MNVLTVFWVVAIMKFISYRSEYNQIYLINWIILARGRFLTKWSRCKNRCCLTLISLLMPLQQGCTCIGRLFGLVDLHQLVSQNALFRVIYKLRISSPKRPLGWYIYIQIESHTTEPWCQRPLGWYLYRNWESHTFESLVVIIKHLAPASKSGNINSIGLRHCNLQKV